MSAPSPGALERLRGAHRRAVTGLLAGGPLSRADLTRATGLSRTTVSSLVTELIASGQVIETTDRGRPHKGGSGRPPLLVALATPGGSVVGVDVGHHHVRVAVADRTGDVLAEETAAVDVDSHGAHTLDRAASMVRAALTRAGLGRDDALAVGMCVPAPLHRASAQIRTGILPGWQGLCPGEELHRRLGLPVFVDNDANLGALAEVGRGAAQGVADLVYVKVASGLGAGIVLGGRLHRGATGIAGELGHVQVGEDGPVCRCGNRGCLETLVSASRLVQVLQPAHDEPLDMARVLGLDADGDPGVRRVLGDAGRTIGRALADLCNSLNPEMVLLGGSLGASPSVALGIREALDRYAQPETAAAVRVAAGSLGDRAEIVGAVSLAIVRVAAT
ncbi:transcriptional regulator [Nocardioides psychrotolerans]|uniref:Sugar kinase of the NBD/HSP70 family, may contain an N-terminal HTH domain n=1 Tax=Nocardioides psychrotolerans TaxID=1005945 RepID=A0A1I3CVD3_9ACTN|nr:ROK family protein [Nocardioides psychrotolerans]GEP36922.1 transcriptional regulator [Nocardioides psychrotolerans]SFH78472.1 Sugar kinase of the NBD/HSP70 family, may contain an N-terminal HTH domain [Nocardioides psychrotolerans]